ncbi:hypothetical protein F4556_005209 [Kitasatospora gansuensis]|uniref:Uncharacterized protein n=1 Tax=Kitasatospora gansuensis TaxID=258050 RepID=A0A7W7SFU7_9ACTN|nr:hypothetical protein [Kitasatospora gansuensis]MBB4949674.1 hypothetical protein [Kitasatospora gansuensis]
MSTDTREFPVLIESTTVTRVWIEAATHAEALRYVAGEPWEFTSRGDQVDALCSIGTRIATEDDHIWLDPAEDEVLGPPPWCPVCGSPHSTGTELRHDMDCPARPRYAPGPLHPGVKPAAAQLAHFYRRLMLEADGWSLEVDRNHITITISPADDTEWTAWVQITGVDPKRIRQLQTYRAASGELGQADYRTAVRTTLIGLRPAGAAKESAAT